MVQDAAHALQEGMAQNLEPPIVHRAGHVLMDFMRSTAMLASVLRVPVRARVAIHGVHGQAVAGVVFAAGSDDLGLADGDEALREGALVGHEGLLEGGDVLPEDRLRWNIDFITEVINIERHNLKKDPRLKAAS